MAKLFMDTWRTVGLEMVKFVLLACVWFPLWVVGLLFPPISPVTTIVGMLFTVMYPAIDYIDWPVARRDLGVRYRIRFFGRNLLPMLGFGSGVWIFLFIPFVNLFFMPAAVAGGTLLYLDLARGENDS